MRRERIAAGGAALAVAAVALAAVALGGGDGDGAANAPGRRATATVERRDLVVREELDGTLTYGDVRPLVAQVAGTVTALAAEGEIVTRGEALFALDGRPVALMYGREPAWRALSAGASDGADIRQLEENLVALGYDGARDIAVDDEFDWATRAAVLRWERARGLDADGIVDLGELVFLPGERRVGSHDVAVGAPVQGGAPVTQTSSTHPVVTLDLEARRQSLVAEGDAVRVELPTGDVVAGRVAEVGKVAEAQGDGGDAGAGSGDDDPTIEVTITLARGARGALDQAPVDVFVEKESKQDALSAPVHALLALAGGGFALEVVTPTGTRLVAVELGLFAEGYVEVAGDVRAGQKVVVAA